MHTEAHQCACVIGFVQSSNVKSFVASMRALSFDYYTEMIAVSWSGGYNPSDSSIEAAVTIVGGRDVVKEGFTMMLWKASHRCSSGY